MKRRARKQWNGGKPPLLSAEDKELIAHIADCSYCKSEYRGECPEGGQALYDRFRESLSAPVAI